MQGRMSVDRGSFPLTPSRNSGCSSAPRCGHVPCVYVATRPVLRPGYGFQLQNYFDSAEFDEYKDLLDSYVNGGVSYAEFVGRAASAERTKISTKTCIRPSTVSTPIDGRFLGRPPKCDRQVRILATRGSIKRKRNAIFFHTLAGRKPRARPSPPWVGQEGPDDLRSPQGTDDAVCTA